MEKKLSSFFYIHSIKLKKVRVIIFPFIPGRFSFIGNATNFFIHSFNRFVLKKNAYALLVFSNWVPYMQPLHMIPGVNIISRKVSVASVNGAGGMGIVWSPTRAPRKIFRLSREFELVYNRFECSRNNYYSRL